MAGSPGSGKTMIAKRIATILPELSWEESLEITKIYSVLGLVDQEYPLITQRPFRNVHHTITRTALTGGGRIPMPGEISMAHGGVLFLDELAEFPRNVLEVLRQPLEEHQIHIARNYGNFTFPAEFMLVAAMNRVRAEIIRMCRNVPVHPGRFRNTLARSASRSWIVWISA